MIRDAKVLEAYLGELLNSMPDATFLVNSTGSLVLVNALTEKMLGYESEQLQGKSIGELIPERFRNVHANHCSDYFARPRSRAMGVGLNLRALRKDGSEVPVEISLSPIETDRGTYVLGAIRDVNESEERYRVIFEQVGVGVVHSNSETRILNVNPKFCDLLGYTRAEALTLDISQLIHPDDIETSVEARATLLAGKRSAYEKEVRLFRKDGSELWTYISTSLVRSAGGTPVHFISLIHDISPQKQTEEKIQHHVEQLQAALQSTVDVATTLSEMRDPYTSGHERRVAGIAVAIGAEFGLDAFRQEGLQIAGQLHDIGKITIPAEILSKPAKLTAIEYQLVQGHPRAGYEVLKDVKFPWPVAEVALQHHERMDGTGYPQGLKGEAILLEARIMAVADVVEAMSSHRPYRPGLGIEKALVEIERGRGMLYDPNVVDACLRLFREGRYQLPV